MTLHIDFETRSELDLRKVGLYNYVRHPSTDVWCMAHSINESEPWTWVPNTEVLDGFKKHVACGMRVFAHNAPFELAVWNEIMVPRYGWPVLKPEQTYCTMAMCYAMGMPGNLEDAALALGLSILKDTEGRNLMLKMADRNRYPVAKPEDLKRLYAYCQQDVRVERELHKRLLPLSDKERKVWLLDYKINQRGVQIDMESAKAAVKLAETVKGQANEKLAKITGGAVQAVTAVAALKEWLADNGVRSDSLAKQVVVDLLETDQPSAVRDALTTRQEAAKASTAKFEVMVRQAGDDGRLRNMYQYHGAATGRWAGRGVQTSNLVRDMPKAETVEKIMALVRAGDYDAIDMIYGAPLSALSRCSRSFFVAPPGKKLISGDWSNVEGRGQAWFAGEDWKLKAFVASDDGSGPGIYELAYSRMFGVPVATVINPSEERQVGKVSELAFGYQGGVGSFHTMSKNYGVKVSDAKAEEFKQAWRAAHPKIVQTWREIQNAALRAVRTPGEVSSCGYPSRQARFRVVGSFLWCLLPSGRAICFPYPKILEGEYGPQLTYMSKPGQDKKDIVYDPKNVSNWARVSTYGGSLFNNIVQGTCRDFLADAMIALDEKGGAIVLHTYDDLNIEVDAAKADRARGAMQEIMETLPAWAAGFPLKAKVEIMQRYGKG
jgi:DNA polymerase